MGKRVERLESFPNVEQRGYVLACSKKKVMYQVFRFFTNLTLEVIEIVLSNNEIQHCNRGRGLIKFYTVIMLWRRY